MDHASPQSQHEGHVSALLLLKRYVQVTKPGIILGNLISVAGGFFLAARGEWQALVLLKTLIGVSAIIAAGCVCNNLIDRDIDALMERTCQRVSVQGLVAPDFCWLYAGLLGLTGFVCLWSVHPLAAWLGCTGFVIYVGLYSLWFKRHSINGTLVGSLSGAMPPVIGYCAMSHQFDSGALILLLMFCFWQIPHSYAIAIFRYRDYQVAGIPVLPVMQGLEKARSHILWYILAFWLAAFMLYPAGYAGIYYAWVTGLVGAIWLWLAIKPAPDGDMRRWARQLFVFSILAICCLSLMMSLDPLIPV